MKAIVISFTLLNIPFGVSVNAESADELLLRAKASHQEGPVYTYDMKFGVGGVVAEAKVDPSAALGSRITILSPAKEDWSIGFSTSLEDMERKNNGDIWCLKFTKYVPDDATLIADNEETSIFEFEPLAEPGNKFDTKFKRGLVGNIEISKEDASVMSYHVRANDSFKPSLSARINSFDLRFDCKPGPDGRRYFANFSMNIAGKALTRKFVEKEDWIISNLQPIE